MSGVSADAIAQELLSRGVPPEEIERVNPALGARVRSGIIAPRLVAPDRVAERGAYIRDYDKLSKRRETLGRYYGEDANLQRFHELNSRQGTGGVKNNVWGIKELNELASPAIKEMSGIASVLQGKAKPDGSGSVSNFEQQLFRMGVPSPEKTGPVNESIINYMRGVMREEQERTAFDEEFLRRNGSLSGSAEAWSRYATSNPYLTQDKHGHTRINTNRADWRAYFGVGSGARRSPAANAPRKGKPDPLGIR